ncbi:12982_t:CDS:2 [Gigaspora margarita]|uniref:12982_t:CDS:1 n=1 Tax=Gigaspora margarita TaxID=4874 RepID=A0ABN7UQX7_GIGMA|nr:12982_t:CDS:2 [Gigaspora margarita]
MLCQYYDIKNADKFSLLFGPLHIGQHPTNSQNKYLVLKFDLSFIDFHSYKIMNKKLGHPDIDKLIVEQASISLQNILSAVDKRSQKLFIGIDEYDMPESNDVDIVEQFFNTNFFAVLKGGCTGPIDKLYVTGVALAFQRPQFYRICRFTEEKIYSIVTCYFDADIKTINDVMDQFRLLYFGNNFVNARSNVKTLFVYNIYLIFYYLKERRSRGFVFKTSEPAAVNSTKILTCIADQSPVSINDLFKLLTNEIVFTKLQSNFNYSDFLKTGGQNIEYYQRLTWSFLYYFRILTCDYAGRLIIPNQVTRTENRSIMSLRTANEAVIQVTFEALLPTSLRAFELRLIVNRTKKNGDGHFGFVDLFVLELEIGQWYQMSY